MYLSMKWNCSKWYENHTSIQFTILFDKIQAKLLLELLENFVK